MAGPKKSPQASSKAANSAKSNTNEPPQEETEQVLFQGPLFGRETNLKANAKLVQAALIPFKTLLSDAIRRRAHTIYFEPREGRVTVRFIIDGVSYPVTAMPAQKGMALVQMGKLLAGLDINERKAEQAGGIKAEFEKIPYRLMVDSVPLKTGGERLRVKIQNQKVSINRPADVGLPVFVRDVIRKHTGSRSGVILVCGPPDSGVTSLAMVVVHSVDPYLYAVYNMSDLKGNELTNVTDFEPEPGHDLETSFERLERREADVMFMKPLTDPHVAQTIFDFSDRLSFIMEVRANTPVEAIQQMIEWVGIDSVLKGLRVVITQKLIRKLCDDCKQAFRPNPVLLKKLNLPPETTVLYRAPSPPPPDDPNAQTIEEMCADCGGTPYHGRAAVYEVLEMTDGMKEVIAESFDAPSVRKQMIADEMLTLQKDALRLVVQGKTSLEELQRTFSPGAGAGKAAKKRPRPKP
ncbi:MAG: ATPase, T2SS/T4P/T4SS family [Planctomyces sp.]|jgi:type II secretory ATPase GspE/PulE/Tfp pilus assembly ATPase PilB-like protein